jgi:hypothetical protein
LCWRPDGKAIAVGLEDGTISLHDVEVSFIVYNICCYFWQTFLNLNEEIGFFFLYVFSMRCLNARMYSDCCAD